MATLAFRPPQFSDDVAWLPAWLQPNQSATKSSQDDDNQNVGFYEGENSQIKESHISTNSERRPNICRLYLSGEDSMPVTLIPSEKTLHFNLHLSAVETSIISSSLEHISEDDKKKSTLALVDSRERGPCNIGNDSAKTDIVPSSSNEKFSGCSGRQNLLSNSGVENTPDILNHKCTECDDICDAVELSVAASEALVIHTASQRESLSDVFSMSAILEIALRVKQARLDGKEVSSCCLKNSGDTADILSDIDDSDMEDAYNDVGLDVRTLNNLQVLSSSQVKETPLSELPGEDKEVQCSLQGDWEMNDIESATNFLENCPAKNKSEDFPAEIVDNVKRKNVFAKAAVDGSFVDHVQNGSLDDLQTEQKGKIAAICVDEFPIQIGVNLSPAIQYSGKEARLDCKSTSHANYEGMNEAFGNAPCKFRSRWLGGWTGMDVKSNFRHTKTTNYFIEETSYLSEPVDAFPDQNSIVHNCHHSLNTSESNKPCEDQYKATSEGAFVSQEVLKSSASPFDPLCSVVPCSISAEIGDSSLPANAYNDHQALDAFKSLPFGRECPLEIAQTRFWDKNNDAGREEHIKLDSDDVGLVIHRKSTSLRTYSTGLPFSFNKKYSSGIVSFDENDARVVTDTTKFPNDKASIEQLSVKSTRSMQEGKEIKLPSIEQCPSCINTSEKEVFNKQAPAKLIFSFTAPTDNMEKHGEKEVEGVVQESFDKSDDSGAEQQVYPKDIPTSPLVLCHRAKRYKAPKLPISDVATVKQSKDQSLAFEKSCFGIQKTSEAGICNLKSDIPSRKRVRFSDESKLQNPQDHVRKKLRRIPTSEYRSNRRVGTRPENHEQGTASQEVKERLTKCRLKGGKRLIFQGLEFLLTGFSKKKEKEIEGLLRKHGGVVLSDVPALLPRPRKRKTLKFNAEKLPVVLCTKKLQTTRFLYGCAVNAFLLKISWAYDSIRVSSVLPPDKYLILSHQINGKLNQIGKAVCQIDNFDHIFEKAGIMLHGTHSFCSKLAKIIKYGCGHVYKSLQWLVQSLEKKKISLAVIVVEDEHRATRHLKKCASEQNITVMPARWVINSLYEGKLLPLMENNHSSNPRVVGVSEVYNPEDWSQEI